MCHAWFMPEDLLERPSVTKECNMCGRVARHSPTARWCQDCLRIKQELYRSKDEVRSHRNRLQRRQRSEKREHIYAEQVALHGEFCRICGNPPGTTTHRGDQTLVIDHDHRCCPQNSYCRECVRGLLCCHCNYALGCFKDDVARLASAIAYLEGNK